MRQETKIINIYKYAELTEEQKQKVLENLADINVDYDWWDGIYMDAENIGLKIEGFDLDRGSYCKIKWIEDSQFTANKIIENHGETCETYKDAKTFLNNWNKLVEEHSDGINTKQVMDDIDHQIEFDDKADKLEDEFLRELSEDYRIMLQNEFEYKISREAIEETIESNEYEFTKDGKIYR